MNRNITIWGITALALCLAFASCPADDSSDDGALANVPKMEPVTNLQDFPETINPSTTIRNVGTRSEAVNLFNGATTVLKAFLAEKDKEAYFQEDNGFPAIADLATGASRQTYTISVNIEEAEFSGGSGNASYSGTINGSNTATATVRSPTTLATYFGASFPGHSPVEGHELATKDDFLTERFSGKRNFVIEEGFINGSNPNNTTYVTGYVTVDYSSTDTKTLTDKENKIITKSFNSNANFSVTIVAYSTAAGTNYGAKFRLSGTAKGNSATTRAVSGGSEGTVSNLTVYTNNGSKIYDLPSDQFNINAKDWFDFAQEIVARSVSQKFVQ